ncbi:PAP2 superfamily [Clostridium pasteurianum DSM 525 = ATCC 6013]|uniref:PAP2 superfamily n=1 Tax=Clostridium pasteurianum DSM 525 = ATCC 6013 TaxID=1262449 RepID=A0A0H3J6W1_CLOPA|nr:phosphatase PAP2 family protein [Clostridium pasteurianum]AJA49646.1 PAP2 superfamily [Clostridium pasteurianum DSM 525 = ATCC 6013]AJA53634.1 PAP2 superfamily [Clostridium pasteurianum DSM 525 = ATCC 6013]AOZ76798.1 phosphatidic acid phosphatase [Clostridium pasteurianum DSM 525 = ATCC 6013]AOZ80595.1 phosphatidic acid phosphatase [Clostridium pasteurianum]ELP58838.1 PAP2 superfamily protein [Clostridium pasteurianum DSM 525 = ATCC 6013]
MNRIRNNIIAFCFMLPILLLNMCYGLLNSSNRGVTSLATDLDARIPFIKEFIIPYVIWYPLVPLVFIYICIKDKLTYCKLLVSLVFGLIISYITFYFFQTTILRPSLVGNDLFTNIIRALYKVDNPFNCFPSIHVMTCFLMIEGIWKCKEKNLFMNISVTILNIIIILSTFFVKQHVVLDAVYGILIALVTFLLANLFIKNKVADLFKKPYLLINRVSLRKTNESDVKY